MRAGYLFSVAAVARPLVALAVDNAATATGPRKIELKDGTTIAIEVDGSMRHHDSKGNPMKMMPGKQMEAKDGTVYEMRNDALSQRLW